MQNSGNETAGPPRVMGIDGGASQSWGVSVDAQGKLLAAARSGSLNFFGSGLAEARRSLKQLYKALVRETPPGPEFSLITIGCAALFEEATPAEKNSLCDGILPMERTQLVSDSMTAYHGATLGNPGVLIVSGTGSIVMARNETGMIRQVGGWGHILGDAGSAYWIALESIKAAIASAEGTGPKTNLGPIICRWFQVQQLSEIIPIIHNPIFTKERLAALSLHLHQRADPEDAAYRDLCRRAGRELATQAAAAIQGAGITTRPVPVFLVGGVVTNDQMVRDHLISALGESFVVAPQPALLSPALGAAALGFAACGIMVSPEIATALETQFQEAKSNGMIANA